MKERYSAMWFLAFVNIATAIIITPNGEFLTNCFTEDNNGECEYSRVKICEDFYACDLMVKVDSPIKRIGYIDNEILIAEGSKTYAINETTSEAVHVKKTIPPWKQLIDERGNKYYTGEGTTYMSDKETGKEIEIITTGTHSYNQLALDLKAKKLFILAFTSHSHLDVKEGQLFAISIDPKYLRIEDDKIIAEHVDGDDKVTSMAVQGSLDKLLLGMRTEKGGKLIRLTRQVGDPCFVPSPKDQIMEVVKDTGDRLLKIFEESNVLNVKSNAFVETYEKNSKNLVVENERLKKEIEILQIKMNAFTSRLFTYSSDLKTRQTVITSTQKYHLNGVDDHTTEKEECLPAKDLAYLHEKISDLIQKEEKLRSQIAEDMFGFLKDISASTTPPSIGVRSFRGITEGKIYFPQNK